MSNLWLNWRFGVYHLQIGPERPWVSFTANEYHRKHPPTKWFERY